jgi:hypothetical protein
MRQTKIMQPQKKDVKSQASGQAPTSAATSATRNMNFFMAVEDHRILRQHSVDVGRSLQSIMAEALNLYLSQHGLGPIKLVKAYRI